MDNLRACYWNIGPGNEWGTRERTGGPESWTVPPPWKLYFNPCLQCIIIILLPPSKNLQRRHKGSKVTWESWELDRSWATEMHLIHRLQLLEPEYGTVCQSTYDYICSRLDRSWKYLIRAIYTVNHKKRWQYICNHNSGKSWWILITFTYLERGINTLCK